MNVCLKARDSQAKSLDADTASGSVLRTDPLPKIMIRKNRAIPIHAIKLLVFDLDGTLVDSRVDLSNSINAMLRHYQRPELPADVIATYIGNGAPMLVRRSLGDPDNEAFVQEALLYFMAYYREHKLDTTHVYDGIKEALEQINSRRNGAPSRPAHAIT